jgi:hypothetical protein
MYLVQTLDKEIRLKRNLHFSVYRQTQTLSHVASSRASTPERANQDIAPPVSDLPGDSAPPEPVALDQYLESEQVMVQATPSDFIDLNVPEVSTVSAPGAMTLKLWISGAGKVVHTEIEKSDFPSAYSDAIAAVFAAANFVPAKLEGLPVNSVLRIETRYE